MIYIIRHCHIGIRLLDSFLFEHLISAVQNCVFQSKDLQKNSNALFKMAESLWDLKNASYYLSFCVLESQYICAGSDLLLNVSLSVSCKLINLLCITLMIYPLLNTDLKLVIY